MAQRGPGRPINPGPQITPKSNIDIPDELVESFLSRVVDADILKEMSEKQLENVINTVKGGLLKATGDASAPNAAAFYTGEYADLKGVQVAFDFQKAWQDPVGYIKGLPLDYIRGILQQGDIEALVEKQVLAHVMREGYLKKAGGSTGEPLMSTGNGLKILEVKRGPAPDGDGLATQVTGIDGKKAYKGLAESVTKWIDDNQSLSKREGAKNAVEDAVHDVLSLELVGHSDFSKNDAAQAAAFEAAIAGDAELDRFVKGYLADSQFNSKYRKALFTDSRGHAFTVEDLLDQTSVGGLNYAHSSMANSYTRRKALRSITGKGISSNKSILKVKQAIQSDSAHFGFSSAAAIDDIFAQIKDDVTMKDFLDKVAPTMLFDKNLRGRASARDVVLFKQIYGEVVSGTSGTLGAIRTQMEKEIYKDYTKVVSAIASKIPASDRSKVEQRVKSALDLKQYVKIRSDVQSAEEFLTAVSKGDVLTNYFFRGVYNGEMPPIIQEISDKILDLKIGRNVTLGDVQNRAMALRDKGLQRIGFSGKASDKHGLLGFASNKKRITLDQVNPNGRTVFYEIGGAKHELQLYQSGKTYENLWQINEDFNTKFFSWKGAEIAVNAKDFTSLPKTIDGLQALAEGYVQNMLSKSAPVNLNDLHTYIADFYRNPGNIASSGFLSHLSAAQQAEYISSFRETFDALKQYDGVLDPKDILSFIEDIADRAGNKGFLGGKAGSYVLRKYLPLLPSIAHRLTTIQTRLLTAFENKILENGLFKLPGNRLYRGIWDLYNPRHGPINLAMKIRDHRLMQFFGRGISKVGNFLSRFKSLSKIASLGQKLLPAALTGPQAALVFIVIAVSRLTKGAFNGTKRFLQGDLFAYFKELKYVVDDLIFKPLVFFGKIIVYILVTVLLIFGLFITLLAPGSVAQYDRDFGITAIIGDIYDDPAAACKAPGSFVGSSSSNFSKTASNPVPTVETSCYGWRTFTQSGVTKYNFHKGIDYGVPTGTPILSPYDGLTTVYSAGPNSSGYGNLVILKADGSEYYMLFAHLSVISVRRGDTIRKGDKIGEVGNTGNSTGPHLHYEIRSGGFGAAYAVNPCSVFSCGPTCSGKSGTNIHGKGACYADYQ